MELALSAFDHEPWRAAAGVALGYGLILFGVFVVLFVLPFVAFLAL